MAWRRPLVFLTALAAAAVVYAPASAPAPPGYTVIAAGTAGGGATWDLSAQKRRVSGLSAICFVFTTKTPGGFDFAGRGCGGGSLRAWHNVFPISAGYGGDIEVNLVGGITVDRARKATITFADGRRLAVPTRIGPAGFRRALGGPVRFFAANAFSVTKAAARWVAVFDSRGRQIGRTKLGA